VNKQIVIAAGIAAAFSVIGGVIFVGSVFMAKEGANVSLTETEDNKVKVVASFFPVYDFARKV
jgi:ABC-type Zn uptake system ZnuABC Zn-binding protein ZnuA